MNPVFNYLNFDICYYKWVR